MDNKNNKEEDEKKLYVTDDDDNHGEQVTSEPDNLDHHGITDPQGEKLIEVSLKLPEVHLGALIEAMKLQDKPTRVPLKVPFSNLAKILSDRPIIRPHPPAPTSTSSSERTITSEDEPSSSSSSRSPARPVNNAAPALLLRIGAWQVVPRNGGSLVLRFDYRTRKLNWEIVLNEGDNSKYKIEIEWSNIIGIQANIEDHRQGILQLELQKPPKFYKTTLSIRHKDKWIEESDFTQGKASLNRRYFSIFPPGVLGKHYKKLMEKSKYLLGVSQKSFPTSNSPHFPHD